MAESISTCHRLEPARNNAPDPSHMSMRTFVQLDSPQPSDDESSACDDDGSVPPLSAHTPPISGTRWVRFFPELSSHFSLSPPMAMNGKEFTPPLPLAEQQDYGNSDEKAPRGPSTPVDLKPASSSSLDDASSCYSRKSSLTSAGSEYIGDHKTGYSRYAFKSADAFSILSPIAAGAFDDRSSVHRFSSNPRPNNSSNKPLPETPPNQLAPLALRRNASSLSYTSDGVFSATSGNSNQIRSPQSSRPGPTFTQAAEELENVLAGFSAGNGPAEENMKILNWPLQISRDNMYMIATRPAPCPPSNAPQKSSMCLARAISRQGIDDRGMSAEQNHARKPAKHKRAFSFSVPGFGRKYRHSRVHIRSFSSSNMRSEMESQPQPHREFEAIPECGNSTETDSKDNVGAFPSVSNHERPRRPSSLGSEPELRRSLPRLQISKMKPVSQDSHLITSSSIERSLGEDQIPVALGSSHVQGKIGTSTGKVFISSSKMRRSNTFVLPYQLGSLQAPEVVHELEASPSLQPSKVGDLPFSAPDRVILSILDHSISLYDLFNFAVVNRDFYRVFKKHELQLIKNALFDMSPPAWELRHMSPPWDAEWQTLVDPDTPVPEYTPTLYLRRYAQDIFILAQLKSLILARCATFLRHGTIRGLAGVDSTRAAEVDEAFWRIWTFCRIFGCRKNREYKTDLQIDWLNGGHMAVGRRSQVTTSIAEPLSMSNDLFEPPAGFGRGNPGGLSQSQLYDMTELWTCLNVLLQPMHGKCVEARETGIFDAFQISEGDNAKEEAVLEEWTSYILTLGLPAVLCLSSICESDTMESTFYSAQSLGLTKWEPLASEGSRSAFLKEAVSKVYKLRENESSSPRPKRLSRSTIYVPEQPVPRSDAGQSSTVTTAGRPNQDNRQRHATFAAELRNQRNRLRNRIESSFAIERPISSYTAIMDQLDGRTRSTPPEPVVPARSLARINMSRRSGAQVPPPQSARAPPPQVQDPADRAIRMIVQGLGFDEADAKWALKITDTGEGVDVDSAVTLLYKERKSSPRHRGPKHSSLISSVMNSRESKNPGWRRH